MEPPPAPPQRRPPKWSPCAPGAWLPAPPRSSEACCVSTAFKHAGGCSTASQHVYMHAAWLRQPCCPDSGRARRAACGSRRPPTCAQLPLGSRAEPRPLGPCRAFLEPLRSAAPKRCPFHRLSPGALTDSLAIQSSHCGLFPPSYCSAHGRPGRGARSAARARLVWRPRSPWYPQSSNIADRTCVVVCVVLWRHL